MTPFKHTRVFLGTDICTCVFSEGGKWGGKGNVCRSGALVHWFGVFLAF